ncbi:hypothetical protein T4D_4054 [Trichinella pseudospiralis]|uniref:Uncharacterized protein n=1 Tax=Trichinella pseudospiralis TaxID=6337 RepID=A0A0V1G2S4_TRIPS|nr:hypothetical protein T4D_4054 [Trichinella pseudospiralis]
MSSPTFPGIFFMNIIDYFAKDLQLIQGCFATFPKESDAFSEICKIEGNKYDITVERLFLHDVKSRIACIKSNNLFFSNLIRLPLANNIHSIKSITFLVAIPFLVQSSLYFNQLLVNDTCRVDKNTHLCHFQHLWPILYTKIHSSHELAAFNNNSEQGTSINWPCLLSQRLTV